MKQFVTLLIVLGLPALAFAPGDSDGITAGILDAITSHLLISDYLRRKVTDGTDLDSGSGSCNIDCKTLM